jgi:trans-2-enoyl-CoA reductase
MLHDFVTLQPGEVILQNAGNSGVGFMTSQLASTLLGVSVVSFARRGKRSNEQWEELVQHLTTVGKCAKVKAEEDLTSREAIKDFHDELKSMSETGLLPSLALNAVGGESASLLCKCLEKGGTMVTFGGMSKLPVTIPTSQLIFRDLRLRGYWHSKWLAENALPTRQQLVDELADAVLRRSIICPPVKEFSFSEVDEALAYDHYEHAIRRKVVFRCQER